MDWAGQHNHVIEIASTTDSTVETESTGITKDGVKNPENGVSAEDANMPPYVCVYMWKRVAPDTEE